MIKRVILDIDNTLIEWKEEYSMKINEALEDLNIPYTKEDINHLNEAFNHYEVEYLSFNREKMLAHINKYTKKQYTQELLNTILYKWGNCVPDKIEEEIIEMLGYLKEKYELVILTDWFKEPQERRLKKLGINDYFQDIFCAENTKRKPYEEAFIQAIGNHKPEECIMIGDDIERDIKGAKNIGIKAIWFNPRKKKTEEKVVQINTWEELKSMI